MNPDKKELFETASVVMLILAFLVCSMLCVKWGVSYQTLVLFAGFIGTLVGAFSNKMRAGSSNQQTGNGTNPKAPTT